MDRDWPSFFQPTGLSFTNPVVFRVSPRVSRPDLRLGRAEEEFLRLGRAGSDLVSVLCETSPIHPTVWAEIRAVRCLELS